VELCVPQLPNYSTIQPPNYITMTQTTPNTQNSTHPPDNPIQVLSQLLGGQQQAVVLVVDEDERLLDYRVQPLSELVADLAVSGLAKPGTKPR